MARIWIPLPDTDFDPTEVAVPWKLAQTLGHSVTFVTENGGTVPRCDPTLLARMRFDMGAEAEAKRFYEEMTHSEEFRNPIPWSSIDPTSFDGLILPGGHAPGMKQYLESETLREQIVKFWTTKKPVGAICHGVLPLARAIDPETGRSVLDGAKSTCMPKYMERAAWLATVWDMGDHYRTYPAYVEEEVTAALGSGEFVRGPFNLRHKGTADDHTHAFVVEDGHYVSGRWPGDAYLFATRFLERL